MEILKETLPTNPYPLLVAAIASLSFAVAMWICSYTYKESRRNYEIVAGYATIFTILFFLFFTVVSLTAHYTYQVLITDDNMFKELAIRGYSVGEMYPGLGQKLYQVSGPIIDWLP